MAKRNSEAVEKEIQSLMKEKDKIREKLLKLNKEHSDLLTRERSAAIEQASVASVEPLAVEVK